MARRSLLAMLLPTPDQIVRSYLTTDENIVLMDQPSTNAFIVEATRELLVLGVVILLIALARRAAVGPTLVGLAASG